MTTPKFSCLFAALALAACGGDDASKTAPAPAAPVDVAQPPASAPAKKPVLPPKLDMVAIKALFGFEPTAPATTNTVTADKVALGKLLYHDTSLSKNGNLSCASCHDLANYGHDGKPVSPGSDGQSGARNSPTTLNAFRQIAQFWDGRAATVEDQAIMPVLNPIEHGIADEPALLAKIAQKAELKAAFAQAFPGETDAVTVANFKAAIGAFERTLTTRSPFDEFLDGKASALSTAQKIGLKTFIDVGCTTCHTSRLVGGNLFQKLGTQRPYPSKDLGRFEVTKNETDKFLFKVPTLLNISKTAPYMHDGSIASLAEVVKIMGQVQLNRELTPDEIAAILAFLEALTGPLPEGVVAR